MPRNRGKKAREKREIVTRELSSEEQSAMLNAILEPPLAISYAVIGALIVEHELEASIKSRLRKISEKEWEGILTDKEGPLGTFDRKIKFASYLGILDANMKTNLDIIRTVRNRFAHTKRLISFDHPFIADELAKIVAPKSDKRSFSRTSKFQPQWRYVSLCINSVGLMSKKRFGARSAAHKAWTKRYQQRAGKIQMGGLLGLLNLSSKTPLPALPISSLPHRKSKTDSDPSDPAPLGLLSGLLPFLDEKGNK
jgi:hypothetical protein